MIKRIRKEYYLIVLLSLLFVLLFCGSVSPLFGFSHTVYNGHDAASIMVAAKGWLTGLIPYRDLYIHEGPIMILINVFGWLIGEKIGVFMIEWFCIFLTMFFTYKLLSMKLSNKFSLFILFLMILPMIGCVSNGNCEQEYLVLLYLLSVYLYFKLNNDYHICFYLLLGLITGIGVCFSPVLSMPLLFISVVVLLKINLNNNFIKKLLLWFIGTVIPIIFVLVYFYFYNALDSLLNATIISRLSFEFLDQKVMFHKFVKLFPIIFCIVLGIKNIKEDKKYSLILLAYSVGILITLFFLDLSWNNYYLSILCIPLYFMVSYNDRKIYNFIYILLICIVFIVPIKNYCQYTYLNDFSGYEALANDLKINLQNNNATFYGIDTPASLYLETHSLPSYTYFINQTNINDYDEYQLFYNYLVNECKDEVLIYKMRGFVEEHIGDYSYVSVYYQGNSAYGIYMRVEVDE